MTNNEGIIKENREKLYKELKKVIDKLKESKGNEQEILDKVKKYLEG